ncbi:response regulator transcription factor [Streptomyces sp. HC44]|uniref:Response regulator transcription factor n=1 Tax=Streptomyces scabichelini TaxID=2711217 RepID=A0A6G4VHW8_9ACTN|nr:response regulator transcription factor [Streptomyces scabichelini]NGO13699.1 response regulator transcription factor [Streptomyces scabichelini]
MIVDSHPSMRLALSTLVESHLHMPVVSAAATVEQALSEIQQKRPSVVITELQLDGRHTGAALCRRVHSLPLRPRVMVFSGCSASSEVAAVLTSGADSFVHKSASVAELVDAIRQTARGRRVWLFGEVAQRGQPTLRAHSPLTPLTEREEQILALLLRRYTNAEIAQELTLAGQTVKNHVSNILHKVGIRNRRELFHGEAVPSK